MSNDQKNRRPLRTEWVPSAYRDDKGADRSSKPTLKCNIRGFAKKVLKKEWGKGR